MKYRHHTIVTLLFLTLCAFQTLAQSNEKPYQEFGEYKVFFTVFNSTFIEPEVASTYKLVRAKDRALINIAVIKGNTYGLPAKIVGSAANLMQQKKQLEFSEITEQGATYYLASLFHLDQEVIHFTIDITPEGETQPHQLIFTRKLYTH